MKYIITPILLMMLLFSMNGCATLKQIDETRKIIETCTFTLRSIQPSIEIKGPSVSLSGIKGGSIKIVFDLEIDVTNTTEMDLSMNRFDLNVFVDNIPVATGTTSQKNSIAAGETKTVSARVYVDAEKATKKLAKKLKGKNVAYRVDGAFYFKIKNFDVPISVTLKEG